MNDPWDVKNVRRSEQYMSCMKINGVPLLPPVLSKECREEMQYYKLLAQEVEKRIQTLKTYVLESDTESTEDKTDAPDLPESEQNDISPDDVDSYNSKEVNKKVSETFSSNTPSPISPLTEIDSVTKTPSSKFVIDLSVSINETSKNNASVDIPERDWECTKPELLTDTEISKAQPVVVEDKLNFSVKVNKDDLTDPLSINFNTDGPQSLSSKSFTGSLNNIHDSLKESQTIPLSRQRSYTILTPSPMLLAHLEIQSLNTGVEINSISMSESLSNLSSPNKKRRSWDLESAKAKWSTMALELKEKNIDKASKEKAVPKTIKKVAQPTPNQVRARSVTRERNKRVANIYKPTPKSEPIQKPKKNQSPVRNSTNISNTPKPALTKPAHNGMERKITPPKQQLISEAEDPATKIRELYEKIQKQQLAQMASLVEKQKKEQMLLQQVFEEQNNLLYSQLKTICPKPGNDIKEAWNDKTDRGPVSLSELINPKNGENCESPVISTLTETNNYLNHCDNLLKKSRDLTGSLKKDRKHHTDEKILPKTSNTKKTHSPVRKNGTSRKLTYETTSSDRDCDLILTDRTNDTMADLNVTFPSDNSDDSQQFTCCNDIKTPQCLSLSASNRSTDRAIKNMEDTIHKSIKSMCARRPPSVCRQATPEERVAATKIVAYAKGFLVRRLMRTERVQGIVQTIKDALLCALQLHQDREGIRGADVDLHRRLIQQITAACYSLHDTFITSSPTERCAMIAADRSRRRSLALRPPSRHRSTDLMTQSHCGAFPARVKRANVSPMTQSNYETFSGEKVTVRRYMPSPRCRPWR